MKDMRDAGVELDEENLHHDGFYHFFDELL
jgi:hypothetical protein